ncbi:MAG: putative multicopper oxidase [Gammaproteobacteria bacterium]|nr:putative multicopper oxidase [Gammaproteobacteria bacterium]
MTIFDSEGRRHSMAAEGSTITPFSRRAFLGAALATGILSTLPASMSVASEAVKRLTAGTRTLEVNGRAARVYSLIGPDGRPGVRLRAGERFRVDLANQSGKPTLVHWHGQLPPWTQDGFPWPETPLIANGAIQPYNYIPVPGTYWMHSHYGMQEQVLMTAPLIVADETTQRENRQEIVLMLHDFTFRSPEEVLANLTNTNAGGARPLVERTDVGSGDAGSARNVAMTGTMNMGMMNMEGRDAPVMQMPGTTPPRMDLNDVDFDAFLANDRTLTDPDVVRVERSGRVRLRIINGASSSQFWIDLGALTGNVVAVDGHSVRPVAGQRFPMAMAQRLDLLIDLPRTGAFPVIAQLEGSPRRTGIILATSGSPVQRVADQGKTAPPVDLSLETRLAAAEPLRARPPDLARTISLGGSMKPYSWSIDGELWPHITPLMVKQGQRVEFELVNHTMMAHPIHLHGHSFQVIAIEGRPIQGAMRDTVLVMPRGGRVRIAFDADNPGRWAFHCHNLYHMQTGMMTEVRYDGLSA